MCSMVVWSPSSRSGTPSLVDVVHVLGVPLDPSCVVKVLEMLPPSAVCLRRLFLKRLSAEQADGIVEMQVSSAPKLDSVRA